MRTIDPAAEAVLNGSVVPLVLLLEMQLTETVRLCSSTYEVTFEGNDYLGVGILGSVGVVNDSPGEYKPLRFNLSGVSTDVLAIAMEEDLRGKRCSLRMAVLNPTTHAVLDAPLNWSGDLDQMPIVLPAEDDGSFSVGATAEHRGMTYARPKPLRYTNVDQQRLFPGDTSLRFIDAQSSHPDVWPAASFGRV